MSLTSRKEGPAPGSFGTCCPGLPGLADPQAQQTLVQKVSLLLCKAVLVSLTKRIPAEMQEASSCG